MRDLGDRSINLLKEVSSDLGLAKRNVISEEIF